MTTRCLNLTHAGEYAISALSRLALLSGPERTPVSIEALARAQKLPRTFLAKVLGRCAKAGVIKTKKGPMGGVSLAKPADDIPLLAIIEACEGGYARAKCVFYSSRPCAGPECEVYCPLRREEESLRVQLGTRTLGEMARSLSVHPDGKKTGGKAWRSQ